jgi:hypothetical protein
MKYSNDTQSTFKSKTLGLALAAFLIPVGMASAHDGNRSPAVVRTNLSGHVEVVHQVPGGVITVGADWGRQRPEPPQVVVVQDRRREVVVVEKRHGHGNGRHRDREVTIIREEPRRQVTIVRTGPACPKTVVIEKRGGNNDRYDNHDDRRMGYDDRDGQQRTVYVRR